MKDNVHKNLQIDDIEADKGSFIIRWSDTCGFGSCIVEKDIDGNWTIDTECMSTEFARALFDKLTSFCIVV